MTSEEEKAKRNLKKLLTESTNMRLDSVIGDLVKKIESDKPTEIDVNHITEIYTQLHDIDNAIKGTKYNPDSGIINRLHQAESALIEVTKRLKNPDDLKQYIDVLIAETLEAGTKKIMSRWSWFLGSLVSIFSIVQMVLAFN